ncbi:hypothetical protein EYF80_032905 [Liparis tanakae]|uniref:Uncharacterized protein n=1 Tax=Liparis tanakae TaxID=230148 RepID=A0A4Z2GUY7_9TELE|nr:hypothetical protein EYF80_032905 [Liparis tanakae]
MSHRRTVPSSAADRNTSLEGWAPRPQMGPSMCPFTKMLHAAFFSPTSIISAFLTERTQSMICPVSNRNALQRFSSWSQSFRAPPSLDLRRNTDSLTAPNATDSMVCIRASSMELSTPFLLSKARPASVQKRTCLIPTDTKCVSESGRNSATKILWMVTVCSGSRPTDRRSFPVALKLTEQTPPEWKQRSTDSVCLVMASHTFSGCGSALLTGGLKQTAGERPSDHAPHRSFNDGYLSSTEGSLCCRWGFTPVMGRMLVDKALMV